MMYKIIPNFLTMLNLFFGIISLIFTIQNYWQYAAVMVIIGMIFDGLDGRMARMLKVQSDFGKELDSLSDVITFGVAPAMIMYNVELQYWGFAGWLITAIFPIAGSLRLARFNIITKSTNYFIGLPITAAGGVLATLALYNDVFQGYVLVLLMLILSFLMISNIKYPNFKKVGIPKSAIWITPILVLIIVTLFLKFPNVTVKLIFVPLFFYALYGNKLIIWRLKKESRKHKEIDELLDEQ